MVWFRVDDDWHDHPKVRKAGNAAAGLWARCGSYSSKYSTDGFVEDDIARRYGTAKEIRTLVTVKLWAVVEGGYQMPDFLDFNPSAEHVKREREAATERQRKKRGHGVTDPVTHAVTTPVSHTHPDPTRPDPPEQVLNNSTPENTPPGVDNSRRSQVLDAYSRAELKASRAKGAQIGNEAKYIDAIRRRATMNPDLDRWLDMFPDAQPSAIAAWLAGDKHSMQYQRRADELAEVHYLPGAS